MRFKCFKKTIEATRVLSEIYTDDAIVDTDGINRTSRALDALKSKIENL